MDTTTSLMSRSESIHAYKQSGGSVAAVFPIHYPRALLRAFDFLPVEVWGPPQADVSAGATHLQPYICSIVQSALAFVKTGGLAVADIIVVPHACDSLQGFGSILLDFVPPGQPVFPIYIPRSSRASDIAFFAAELRDLFQQLEALSGATPSDADLMACIQRDEAGDAALASLHQSRPFLPIPDHDFYRLVRSREYLPVEVFTDMAHDALNQREENRQPGIPLLLSGIVPEPMSLFSSIGAMGGVVVADDLACCGRRLYPPGTSDDPFAHLAERILHAPPDSTRGTPLQARLDHLLAMVEDSGARGVIFYITKFCEPELFDLPDLRKGLQKAGIPSLIVEVDINDQLSRQVLTRLEAFLEMVA